MQLVNCTQCDGSIDFDLQLIRGLLFTESLIAPTDTEHTSPSLSISTDVSPSYFADVTSRFDRAPVRALTGDQQRAPWHCRLGHTLSRNDLDLHKYVDGIPKLPRSDPLSECPFCKQTKLHKADHGPIKDFVPDVCWQDIQIDLGFMIQSSTRKDAATPSTTPRRLPRHKHGGNANANVFDLDLFRIERHTHMTRPYSVLRTHYAMLKRLRQTIRSIVPLMYMLCPRELVNLPD